jgi:hypothetical protein
MQIADDFAHRRRIAGVKRAYHFGDEVFPQRSVGVARSDRSWRRGNIVLIEHARPPS